MEEKEALQRTMEEVRKNCGMVYANAKCAQVRIQVDEENVVAMDGQMDVLGFSTTFLL